MNREQLSTEVTAALKQFRQIGLRWAYIINGALIVIALVVNHFLPHGWVAWPAVLAIGIIVMINEAVDRNGQGFPPLVVYGCVCAFLVVWVGLAFIFSAIAPILFFIGLPAAGIFGFVAWRRERRAQLLADQRCMNGQCVNCGAAVDVKFGACGNCGREVDKVETLLARVRNAVGATTTDEAVEHRREVLQPALPTIAAQRKEKALLERKRKARLKRPAAGSAGANLPE